MRSPRIIRPKRISPNAARFRTLTSRVSWPGRTFSECSLASLIQHHPFEPRIAQRDQGASFEIRHEAPDPESADADPGGEIRPMEIWAAAVGGERRHRQPINVNGAHDDQ